MKLLPITSESIGFKLTSTPDAPKIFVGASFRITTRIMSPMSFSKLIVCGVTATGLLEEVGGWRIDEVMIDDVSVMQSIEGSWGVGRSVYMRVTNVGAESAHFRAVWELEDVNGGSHE